jgi:hypothetical protein
MGEKKRQMAQIGLRTTVSTIQSITEAGWMQKMSCLIFVTAVVVLNMAGVSRKCLVTIVDRQGKSVIEPASRVVDFYFFETLLDIFHGLQDVPSAVLLHVVLRQNAMSDPASDTQWSDLDATMATIEDTMSVLWGSHSCRALCFVVERNAVHRQPGNAFDRMMSNARTAFGHIDLVTPEFVANMYANETGYQRNCGDRLRLYLQDIGAGFMSVTPERTRHQCFRALNSIFCSVTDQVKKSLSRDCPDDTWRRIQSMLGLERSPAAQRCRQDSIDDTVKAVQTFYLDTECQKCVSVMLVACTVLCCQPPHDDGCHAQQSCCADRMFTCKQRNPCSVSASQVQCLTAPKTLQVAEQQGVGYSQG